MFEDQISFFENLNASPKKLTLKKALEYCTSGWIYERQIVEYRQSGDKSLKRKLPSITVGAIFEGGRKNQNIVNRTGWVAIDIDAKDNPHLPSAEHVRDAIIKIQYVAYAGLSVSGKGVWALIKIKDPMKQAEYFEQMKIDFKSKGIVLDPTKGKNPNDLRFISFDPDGAFRNDYKLYDRLPKKKLSPLRKRSKTANSGTTIDNLIRQIAVRRLNIAPDYDTYMRIGFALADEFDERGRSYFHEIVCYSEKYSRREADFQFTNCLNSRSSGSKTTIATFYYLCKKHGLTFKNNEKSRYKSFNSFKPSLRESYGFDPETGEVYENVYPIA